jgi:hypothetical protein
MHSYPQEGAFNMEPCWVCEEKLLSHTITAKEKQFNRKKATQSSSHLVKNLKTPHPHKENRQFSTSEHQLRVSLLGKFS